MKSRNITWTKAAIFICALFQILNGLSVLLLLAAAVHVMINPDAINTTQPVSVSFLFMDLSLNDTFIYSPRGAATVPGVVSYLVIGSLRSAMSFSAFGKIREVIEYAQSQPPFRRENVEKLRGAGGLFLGTVVLQLVYTLLSMMFAFGDMSFSANLSFDNVVIGIIVLCVSEIFAGSVRMQEEQDELV